MSKHGAEEETVFIEEREKLKCRSGSLKQEQK